MILSVITVNYNNVEGLIRTIRSIENQRWTDFEWIIVDGGSIDGSKEEIEKIAKDNKKISRWCSEKDKGIYNAMNKGISWAKGEYLVFMNSGDCFFDNTTLERVFAIKQESDILYGGADYYKNGQYAYSGKYPSKISASYFLKGGCINHQSTFIRRSIIEKELYDESYRLAADCAFILKALLEGATSKYLGITVSICETGGQGENDFLCEKERRTYIQKVLLPFFPSTTEDILYYYYKRRIYQKMTSVVIRIYGLIENLISLIKK